MRFIQVSCRLGLYLFCANSPIRSPMRSKIPQYPWLSHWQKTLIQRLQPIPESADYRAWRDRFILDRYRLCLWIAMVYSTIGFAFFVNFFFLDPKQAIEDATKIFSDPTLLDRVRPFSIINYVTRMGLLSILGILWRKHWGKQHPALLFIFFSWSMHFIPDTIIGTFFGIPTPPDVTLFMAQVMLMPVHWRMHFFAQLPPLLSFTILYPLIGLTKIGVRPIYEPTIITQSILLCVICVASVYLYEKLKLSEFEAQRRVNVFIRSIAHDLRTPIMGTVMLLQSLRHNAQTGTAKLTVSDIDQLLDGNDRLLGLMNSLLDIHLPGNPALLVNPQPIQFKTLVDAVLLDLQSSIHKNRVQLSNQIPDRLPSIHADSQLLWRVLYNLLSNAWKHNRPGIHLKIAAEVVNGKELRCTIQDDGVGIPQPQVDRLFELYSRGEKARYIPGLGIGLYICRQILLAHDGQIGAISTSDRGVTFWFTLPIVEASSSKDGIDDNQEST
jgi:signal transduction histidine kinase